jgi:hypothetical protein
VELNNFERKYALTKCTVAKECRNAPCFLLTTRVHKKVKLRIIILAKIVHGTRSKSQSIAISSA